MKVAGAKTNQVLGPGGLKSVGERLTQKPLPGRVNAAFKIGTDERVIVARLHEMGLDEESNFLRGSKDVKNRTELSRLVDEIRTRYGVEIYGRPQGQARAIDIYERTDKKVGVNFGQPALQDPAQAVAELRDLKEKLGEIEELEKVGVIVVDKTDFVLWGTSDLKGNPLVSKLGKTIDKASAHGEKFYADKDQLRDAEAAGIASWKGIGLDTKGMVKNPNRAVGTGLHEIKHRSTDSKEILDRNINFSSESKSLPESTTHQYKDYFRSDELEARLPQLAHYRGVRLSGDRSLASSESWQAKNAFAFVKAQRKIIREIQAKQTLPTHAPDGWKYVVNVDGKPVDVSLPDNWGKLKFDPNAVLKKRLEVLDKLESHLLKYYEPSGSFKPVVPR